MMGPQANCVVDSELRVHGIDGPARHRRLGDAVGDLDQHQRADDHDRREGRRDDQGGGAAAAGGVDGLSPSPAMRERVPGEATAGEGSHASLTLPRSRRAPPSRDGRGTIRCGGAMQADYVIVGAGSAGCVLANRLSADPANRVILIEAGGRDWNPLIHIPAGYVKLLDHPKLTWGFTAEPDPGVNNRAILYPRGRVVGGSSSINGMIYVRGQPEDFDHWGQLGNRGWSWDDVLPYFKRGRKLAGGRQRFSRIRRAAVDLAYLRQAGPVREDHRGRRGDRSRIPRGRQPPAAGLAGRHRLGAADPPRPAAPERGAHLSAPGIAAAEPAARHRRAGASRAVRRQARGRGRILARRARSSAPRRWPR